MKPHITYWRKKPHITYWLGTWRCRRLYGSRRMDYSGYGYTPSEAYREWLIVNGYTEAARSAAQR